MSPLRQIPSIDALLREPVLLPSLASEGRARVVDALRRAAQALRTSTSTEWPDHPGQWIAARALEGLRQDALPSLRPVINASGVIIHTNLGRAPLADAAARRAAEVASGYANLEFDLAQGGRGHRHVHAERLLCDLAGTDSAVITNNNAAATWLVLATLASGREVIVSRGELVEIGGGFRIPDIMARSGATLREVGTTNRTRLADYAAAINDKTALILRVHPSNFTVEGFTERPDLAELAGLAQRFSLPLFEDQGSGWLGLPHEGGWPAALDAEPSVLASVSAGVPLIAFSGDKLLGGPQAGIIIGSRALVDQVRRHPLMRAVRADKQTYAALEATLALWQREPARVQIPVVRMLLEPLEAIRQRSAALAERLQGLAAFRDSELTCELIDGDSTIGGGSAPQSRIATCLIALTPKKRTASELEAALRTGPTPVVARIQNDTVLVDLRTVAPDEEERLVAAVGGAVD